MNDDSSIKQVTSDPFAALRVILGVIPSVVFGGCMTIGVVIVTWFKAPSLRKMQY